MNDEFVLLFNKHRICVLHVLTDRGCEYSGRAATQPYELRLYLNGMEHTRTKPKSPQTNGAVERLNRSIANKLYEALFRKKLCRIIEEI